MQAWRATAEPVANAIAQGAACAQALNAAARGNALLQDRSFVAQSALPAGMAYESYIFQTGQIPTREHVHDFFNGMAWLLFTRTKARINALQAQHIAQQGIQTQRGPVRDALTVLDENGAFIQAPDALWQALTAKDWQQAFVQLRPLWSHTRIHFFGHALVEKLLTPRKAITAHLYRVPLEHCNRHAVDAWVARDLKASSLAAKPFAHLPVLGIPGWCNDNANPTFYADPLVFRPPQKSQTAVANS